MRLITHSEMESFLKCRQYHHNRYILLVRPEPSEALRMGTAIHRGIEALNKSETLNAALDRIRLDYAKQQAQAITQEWYEKLAYELVKVERLIEGWHARWQGTAIQIIATELRFTVPIVNPETGKPSLTFERGGKIDAIIRLEDGRLAIYELKSASEDIAIGSEYWKIKSIDAQIARYVLAARELGHDIATILYDAIRKPEIRPRQIPIVGTDGFKIVHDANGDRVWLSNAKGEQTKPRESGDAMKGYTLQTRIESPSEYGLRLAEDIAERPEFYFARTEVPRLDHELAEAEADMWDIAKDIRDMERNGRHYINTRACKGFGTCEYLDHCVNRTDLSGNVPEGFLRLTTPHPELENENGNTTSSPLCGEGSGCAAAPAAPSEGSDTAIDSPTGESITG